MLFPKLLSNGLKKMEETNIFIYSIYFLYDNVSNHRYDSKCKELIIHCVH